MMARTAAMILLFLPLMVSGQWRPWSNVWTAVEDVVEATRERLEATYDRTVVTTQQVARCSGGTVVTNLLILTNRLYLVQAGAIANDLGGPGDFAFGEPIAVNGPINVFWSGPELRTTNLIYAGSQTNIWTNGVGAVVVSTAATFRSDSMWVRTSRYDCAVSTNLLSYRWMTSAPPAWVSWSFLDAVDGALDELMDHEMFVDHSRAGTDGTFTAWFEGVVSTNWTWTNGAWQIAGYTHPTDFPRLDRERVWSLTGVGTSIETVVVTDLGTNLPVVVTNRVQGWTVGDLGSEFVDVVSTNARWVAVTNTEYVYRYGPASSNVLLYSLMAGRWSNGSMCQASGFGVGLDGVYSSTGDALAVALSNAGWSLSARVDANPAPYGCWSKTTSVAEVTLPAVILGWSEQTFESTARVPREYPELVIWQTTQEVASCSGVSIKPFSEPYQVRVCGRYWQPATATSSTMLVTSTQILTVASTGRVVLADRLVSVSSIVVSNPAAGRPGYALAAGLQMAVRYPARAFPFARSLPLMVASNALAERRSVLGALRWSAPALAGWTNIQRGAETLTTAQVHVVSSSYLGSSGCTSVLGAAFSAVACPASWPTMSQTNELSSAWLSWDQDCVSVTGSRRYDGSYLPSIGGSSVDGATLVQFSSNIVSWSAVKQRADARVIVSDRLAAEVVRYEAWSAPLAEIVETALPAITIACAQTSRWACVDGWPDWYCEGDLMSDPSPCGGGEVPGARVAETVGSVSRSSALAVPDRSAFIVADSSDHVLGASSEVRFAIDPSSDLAVVAHGTNISASAVCEYYRHYGAGGEYDESASGALTWLYDLSRSRSRAELTNLRTLILSKWQFRYARQD